MADVSTESYGYIGAAARAGGATFTYRYQLVTTGGAPIGDIITDGDTTPLGAVTTAINGSGGGSLSSVVVSPANLQFFNDSGSSWGTAYGVKVEYNNGSWNTAFIADFGPTPDSYLMGDGFKLTINSITINVTDSLA